MGTAQVSLPTTSSDPFQPFDLLNTRRFGPSLLVDNVAGGQLSVPMQEMMTLAKQNGATFLQAGVSWPSLEPTTAGVYNFDALDAVLNTCQTHNWKLLLRFVFVRNGGNNSAQFISTADLARDQTGTPYSRADCIVASLNAEHFNLRVEAAIQAALQHIKDIGKAGLLGGVSVTMNQTAEGQYAVTNEYNGGPEVGALFGYSDDDKAAFRTWAQTKYGNITAINAAWGTGYGTIGNINTPVVSPSQTGGNDWNPDNQQKRDFFEFRTWALARFHNRMADKVYAISPNIPMIAEFGNFQDGLSQTGGTWLIRPYLSSKFKMIKSNDESGNGSTYPLDLSTAICRADWTAAGATEIYAGGTINNSNIQSSGSYTIQQMIDQYTDVFDNGGSLGVYFSPFLSNADNHAPAIAESKRRMAAVFQGVQTWLNNNQPRTTWDKTMTVPASTISQYGYAAPYGGGGTIRQRYAAEREGGTKRVRFMILTSNMDRASAPVVAQAPATQSATIGQGFNVTLAANTFTDPGNLALTYAWTNLPAGLSGNGLTLSGIPSGSAGTFTATLRATNTAGLSTSTNVTVVYTAATPPTPPVAQAPVVAQAPATQNATIGQGFTVNPGR